LPLLTVAVPTVVPPLQTVGAEDCGPNTLNVTVPVGPDPPDSIELIDPAAIAVSTVPVPGADTVTIGELRTDVEAIPAPQPLFDAALLASPP
jgi:hypothetical protein